MNLLRLAITYSLSASRKIFILLNRHHKELGHSITMNRDRYPPRLKHSSQRQHHRIKHLIRRLLAYETLEDRSLMAYESVDFGHVSIDVDRSEESWNIKIDNTKSGEKGTLWIRQKENTNHLEAAYSASIYSDTLQGSIPSSAWQSLELTTLTKDLRFTGGAGEVPIVFGSIDTNGYDFLVSGDENFRSDLFVAAGSIIDTVSDNSTNQVGDIVLATHWSITVNGSLIAAPGEGHEGLSGDITLDSYDRANIADAGPDDRHINLTNAELRGKEISITADRINRKLAKQIYGVDSNTIEINILNSTIEGENIEIEATAKDEIAFDYPKKIAGKYASGIAMEFLGEILEKGFHHFINHFFDSQLILPISIFDRQASAKVTIIDSDLFAENEITIASDVKSQSEAEAIATKPWLSSKNPLEVTLGYGRSKATASTVLDGETTLTTDHGDISVTADGEAESVIISRTLAPYKSKGILNDTSQKPSDLIMGSVSIGLANLDLETNVGPSTTIQSGGNVLIQSEGATTATAYSTTRAYDDGFVGITFSTGKSNATVETIVDGDVYANGAAVPKLLFQKPQSRSDSLTYDSSLGWKRGDLVTYSIPGYDPNAPEPIAGLIRGNPYYITEILQDTIKLAEKMELDLGLPLGNADSQQSFDVVSTKDFNPQTALDTATSTFTINSHGLSNGQQVQYQLYGNTPSGNSQEDAPNEPIAGLIDGQYYYVIKLDENRFKLATTPENVTSNIPISIAGPGKGTVHAFRYVSRSVSFNPRTILNPDTNSFNFDTQGIQTGDPLIYHVDPTKRQEVGFTRQALFSPSQSTIEFDPTTTVTLSTKVYDLTDNLFVLKNHGLKTGDTLTYRRIEGDALLTVDQNELQDDTTLYAIVIDSNRIQVARTLGNAQSATEIVFEQPDASKQSFTTASKSWTFDPTAAVVVPSVDVQDNLILFSNPHRLVSGQRIVYQPGTGNAPIGGLTEGASYYVAVLNESLIQLAKTPADLDSGTMVDLAGGASLVAGKHQFIAANTDIVNDWIVTQNHGLQTGQSVNYENEGGLPIGGLVPGSTYTVIRLDESRVRLAKNLSDASGTSPRWIDLTQTGSGTYQFLDISTTVNRFDPSQTTDTVDLIQNTLKIPRKSGNPWVTGQKVRYLAAGDSPIGGLVNEAEYYVIAESADLIQLASSLANANAKIAIDLTTKGAFSLGNHILQILPTIELIGDDLDYEAFDPTATQAIRPSDDSLRIPGHGYSTGQQVTYLSGAGASILGLVNGQTYYLIVLDQDHVQLSLTAQGAQDGIVIAIESGATGDRHGFEVPLSYGSSDPAILGLTTDETYYAIVDGPNKLRLAKSAVESFLAVPISFDVSSWPTNSGDAYWSQPDKYEGIKITSVLEASNDSEAYPTLGGMPSLWEILSYPEFAFATFRNIEAFAGYNRINFYKNTPKQGSGASAVALAYSDHHVTTTVSGFLSTPKNIAIESEINHRTKTVSWGGVSSTADKTAGVAASVTDSFYINNALTEIKPTAQINAGESLEIESNVIYPRLLSLNDISFKSVLTHIPALLNNIGLIKFINVFANSTVFSDKDIQKAFAGSIAITSYETHSRAIVRDGAKINQIEDYQSDKQNVKVEAVTSLELIGLAGEINFDPNLAKLLRSIEEERFSKEFFGQFNLKGSKASKAEWFAIGASEFYAAANSETIARIEGGALVHSGKKGGLEVVAHEYGRKNVLAQSGANSDAWGIGLSSGQSIQKSITIAQVAGGATITGGELAIDSSSDSGHIVGSGGVLSAGPVGIGLSFGYLNSDRNTHAILGDIPKALLDDLKQYEIFTDDYKSIDKFGSIEVTKLDVGSLNTGNNWNVAVVGAKATARKKPAVGPQAVDQQIRLEEIGVDAVVRVSERDGLQVHNEQSNKSSSKAISGDAVYSNIKDKTFAFVDSMRFVHFSIVNEEDPVTANLEITGSNESKSWALAGAIAIANRQSNVDGVSVAFAGSFAVNRLDWDTKAQLIDSTSDPQRRSPIYVGGNLEIHATAGKAPEENAEDNEDPLDQLDVSLLAAAASVGYANGNGGTPISAVYSLAFNRITGETIASIESADLKVGSDVIGTGEVVVDAGNYHFLTGDAGGFSVARNSLAGEGNAYSVGIGGSNAFNLLGKKDSDAYRVVATITNGADIEAESVEVLANDYSKILALTVAGGMANGLALTESGSQNVIRRTIKSIIGDEEDDDQADTTDIKTGKSIDVRAQDQSLIWSLSGTAQIAIVHNKSDIDGAIGAAWSSNKVYDESVTKAAVSRATIEPIDAAQSVQPTVEVVASSQADIQAITTSLGVLYSGSKTSANLAGAIAVNRIGGDIAALVADSSINATALAVEALSNSKIHSLVVSGQISISTKNTGELTVGLGVTHNEITTDTLAQLDKSEIVLVGELALNASAANSIISQVENGEIQFAIEKGGENVALNWIGVWATNEIRSSTKATVHASSIGTALQKVETVSIHSQDTSTVVVKGIGGLIGIEYGGSLVIAIGALTQIAENDLALDVQATVSDGSTIFAEERFSVEAIKQVNVASHIVAVSFGVAITSLGEAVNLSTADTVVRNHLESTSKDGKQYRSNTHALVEDSEVVAGSASVSAILSPWIYSKIWDVDLQAGVATNGAALAAVYGEAKSKTILKDDTQAKIQGSSIVSESGDIEVKASIDLPDSTQLPDDSVIHFPDIAKTTNIYADTHSVGVSLAVGIMFGYPLYSFAATIVRSDVDSVSQNTITARIVDSQIDAFGNVHVLSDDHSAMYGQIKSTSVAVAAIAYAASIPNLYQSQENTVNAKIETAGQDSPHQSYEVESQTGDIQVLAQSDGSILSDAVVWSAVFGVAVSESATHNQTYLKPTMNVSVAGLLSNPLELRSSKGDIQVGGNFNGAADSVIKSGSIAAALGAVNTVRLTTETSPSMNVSIAKQTNLDAAGKIQLAANATGHAHGRTVQATYGLGFAGAGLTIHSDAKPNLSVTIGMPDTATSDLFETNLTAHGNIGILARSTIDSIAESGNNGGSLIVTVINTNSYAIVEPHVDVTIGSYATLQSVRGGIEIQGLGGVDQGERPTGFNATTDVDSQLDTITFQENHRLLSGDIVKYDASGTSTIDGLEDQREYPIVWINAKKVSLGVGFDSDVSPILLPNDVVYLGSQTSTFKGPFDLKDWDPTSWDKLVYHQVGSQPVGGLIDGKSYYINRINAHEVMLVDTDNVPAKPTSIDGDFIGANGTFTLAGHGFSDLQNVAYRAATGVSFDSAAIDQKNDSSGNLTADNSNPNTIYIGDKIDSFGSDGEVVYTSDANPGDWFWTEGPDPNQDSSNQLMGTRFWTNTSSGSGNGNSSGNYANWGTGQPTADTGNISGFANFSLNQSTLDSSKSVITITQKTASGEADIPVSATWMNARVPLDSDFTVSFTYQASGDKAADGIALVFQNAGINVIGNAGGGLGYAGIPGAKAAYKMNLYMPNGVGTNFTTSDPQTSYLSTSPVNIQSGNPIRVTLKYDATKHTIAESLEEFFSDGSSKNHSHVYDKVDLVASLSDKYAYIGLTGAYGGSTSTQKVWDFSAKFSPIDSHALMTPQGTWAAITEAQWLEYYVLERPQFVRYDDPKNWEDAKTAATNLGGWLASIDSDEELQRAKDIAGGHAVWLGGSDDTKEGKWVWDTLDDPLNNKQFWDGGPKGSANRFANWGSKQPDNNGPGLKSENALMMQSDGTWNDMHRTDIKLSYLVEYPQFQVVQFKGTFAEAQADAKKKSGWIAPVGSKEHNDTISTLLTGKGPAWIGGSNSASIKGLVDGERYWLEKVTGDDPNHNKSVRLYSLNSSGGKGSLIEITGQGVPRNIDQKLLKVDQLPLGGLESGKTYYVIKTSADQFQLAASLDDARNRQAIQDITVKDGKSGKVIGKEGYLGTLGVDLTSMGVGKQQLVFDISAPSNNAIQHLNYIKATNKPVPTSTGTARSVSHTAGGSLLFSYLFPEANSEANPQVTINADTGSQLFASNVDITAVAPGNAISTAEAYGGGLFMSDSHANANSILKHSAKVNLKGSIHATNDLIVESKVSDEAQSHTDTASYAALVALSEANSRISNSFDSMITVGNGASLTALNSVSLNAYRAFGGQISATTKAGAAGGDSKANWNDDSGIHFEKVDDYTNTTMVVLGDALLQSPTINLHAMGLALKTDKDPNIYSKGGGIFLPRKSKSKIYIKDDSIKVLLNADSKIHTKTLNMAAQQDNVLLHSIASTGKGSETTAHAELSLYTNAEIITDPKSIVVADTINVDSVQNVNPSNLLIETHTANDVETSTNVNPTRKINWNANVWGRLAGELLVDENRNVQSLEGLTVQGGYLSGSTIPIGAPIVVSSVNQLTKMAQSINFTINALESFTDNQSSPNTASSVSLKGASTYGAIPTVEMINQSKLDLVLPAINLPDLANSVVATKPNPTINLPTGITSTFAFGTQSGTKEDGIINVQNTWADLAQARSTLKLTGPLTNKRGIVKLINLSGDIATTVDTTGPTINAAIVNLEAAGDIGTIKTASTDRNRLYATLNQSPYFGSALTADSKKSLIITVRPELQSGATSYSGIQRLAGDLVNVELLPSISNSPVTYTIGNHETSVSSLSRVINGNSGVTILGLDATRQSLSSSLPMVSLDAHLVTNGVLRVETNGDIKLYQNASALVPAEIRSLQVDRIVSKAGSISLDFPSDLIVTNSIKTLGSTGQVTWSGGGKIRTSPTTTDNHPILETSTLYFDGSGGTGSALLLTPVGINALMIRDVADSIYLFNQGNLDVQGVALASGNLELISSGTMSVSGSIDVKGGGNLTLAAQGSAMNTDLNFPIEESAKNLFFGLAVDAPIVSYGGNINLVAAFGVRLEPIYRIQRGSFTSNEARLDAQSRGGWLAPLAIDSVNNWVNSELYKIPTDQEIWAGGSDSQQEGSWRWTEGPAAGKMSSNVRGIEFYYETIDNKFQYDPNKTLNRKWGNDEPNNFNNNEDYLTIVKNTSYAMWNDNNGNNPRTGYVLQLPTVQSSGTGQIVVSSGTLISQSNAIQVGQDNATIHMTAGAAITSKGGNIVLLSTGNVYLGTLETQKDGTDIANQEAVLVVADYRGVDGSLPQGTGKIINNLSGGLLNIVADDAMLTAGGENEIATNPSLAWTGVGQKANPITTQVDTLAASSYLGGIYVENVGDLTIGQASLQMRGKLAEVFNFHDAVPIRALPNVISTLYSGRDPSDPYIGQINGRFTVGGLAVMSSTGSTSTQADIRVNSTKSLLVEQDIPVFNQDAGQIVLSSLAPIDWSNTFIYQSTKRTIANANSDATSKGGWISAITSDAVNQYVSYLGTKNATNVWIGASDSATEGVWIWDLGSMQTSPFYKGRSSIGAAQSGWYSKWSSGEPNDFSSNEDYAELIYSTTSSINGTWNDISNVSTNTRPYVLQKDPSNSVTILSPMFSTAGTDSIHTFRGYRELTIPVPIPESTCDTYYAMRIAQGDGSETYKESLTHMLTISNCEPYIPSGSGESPMLGSSRSTGGAEDQALRFFVSMDKQARDQARYYDASEIPLFPILSDEAGEHVIYARVLHPSGEFTDYQKTITVVDNPPEQILIDPIRAPLSVGQLAKATISFEDTNPNDNFLATLDWGDGTALQQIDLGSSRLFNAVHPYTKPGKHDLTIKLTDMSTGLWSTATTEFYVGGTGISAGQLQVIGSDQRDQITVIVDPRTTTVVTRFGNGKTTTQRYSTKDFSSLYVTTFDGDDFINIVGGSTIPTRIESGRGNDYVQSGRGASTIEDLSGNNRIFAGSAADIIRTGLGNDEINAGAGDNQIFDLGGNNRIIALQGSDVIETGTGNDYIHAGSGHNTIKDAGGANQIHTLHGNDTIEVTGSRNRIFAGGGKNTIRKIISDTNQSSSVLVTSYGLDVNGDGVVSPLDVLTLIDRINHSMMQASLAISSSEAALDTDGDGMVSPLDVLSVIDYLNGVNQTGAEGELVDPMPMDMESIRRETDEEYYDAVFASLDKDEFE